MEGSRDEDDCTVGNRMKSTVGSVFHGCWVTIVGYSGIIQVLKAGGCGDAHARVY